MFGVDQDPVESGNRSDRLGHASSGDGEPHANTRFTLVERISEVSSLVHGEVLGGGCSG